MELRANEQISGYPSQLYKINEIFSERDPGAIQDPKFTAALNKSLDSIGMRYPIIITTQRSFLKWINQNPHKDLFPKPFEVPNKYRVSIGNNRFFWAVSRGYTEIECIFTEEWDDSKEILKKMNMNYGEHF